MVSSTYGSLAGKVAIITGASRGIGAATALQLASLGAKVVINYAASSSAAEELVSKIGKENAIAVKADVSTVAGNEQLVKEAVAWGGRIDILIANAGLLLMKTLEATTEEDFQRTYDLNVKGPYFLVQKAVPYLSEGARVVLMSTTLTGFSSVTPDYLLYCSSKGAIEQMTRIMAKDLAKKKINV